MQFYTHSIVIVKLVDFTIKLRVFSTATNYYRRTHLIICVHFRRTLLPNINTFCSRLLLQKKLKRKKAYAVQIRLLRSRCNKNLRLKLFLNNVDTTKNQSKSFSFLDLHFLSLYIKNVM